MTLWLSLTALCSVVNGSLSASMLGSTFTSARAGVSSRPIKNSERARRSVELGGNIVEAMGAFGRRSRSEPVVDAARGGIDSRAER